MHAARTSPEQLLQQAAADFAARRWAKAYDAWSAVLKHEPDNPVALRGAARTAWLTGQRDKAVALWSRLGKHLPRDPEVLFELGNAALRKADHGAAISAYRDALQEAPDFCEARGMLVIAMLYAGVDDAELWRAQREWGALRLPPSRFVSSDHPNPPDPDRTIRIGYLSSDFRSHPTGLSMIPVYEFHDRRQYEIYSYAHIVKSDAGTEEIRRRSDAWRDVTALDDRAVAAQIVSDRIDILIVLTGHMDQNRPFVARYRPAPIQVSHHDLCTTAMPEFDYLIADFTIAPRNGAERFSERVLRLPCWTVYPIPAEAPSVTPPPMLTNGYVTFGSFNNPAKITAAVADLWCEVLHAVPEARLLLRHIDSYRERAVRERILGLFTARGIEAARIEIDDALHPRSRHLAQYERIDVALDPFPFNGATTTFEALLMGVPVVALRGERLAARYAASLLDSVGLGLCVASDRTSYALRAVELARDGQRLAKLREALRGLVTSSRLCDARRYTRNLERFYRAMWRRWCATRRARASG